MRLNNIRQKAISVDTWRNLFDDYDNVYMNKSLANKLVSRCSKLLQNGKDDLDFIMKNKTIVVSTQHGKVNLIFKQSVLIVKYSDEFEENYRIAMEEYKEVEEFLNKIIQEYE